MSIKITEGNYQKYYYPERNDSPKWLDDSLRPTDDPKSVSIFLHPEDARRWADRAGWGKASIYVNEIILPYAIEYQDAPIWQVQRRYISLAVALNAWPQVIEKARHSSLNDRVWRLIFEPTQEVVKVLSLSGVGVTQT